VTHASGPASHESTTVGQAIDGDNDMLTAMARVLVENKGIGESADGVWHALGQFATFVA